jgi:hypothetical protein
MKHLILMGIIFCCLNNYAQELFVYTEPASNMAKGNLGIRIMTFAMKEKIGNGYTTHVMPELMYGIDNKWMVHATGFISDRNTSFITEGGSLYTKFKFLNLDQVQKHFRMATFFRYSFNTADIHQEEINLMGHNSGYEMGVNATQLLHKVAISGGVSFINAQNNGTKYGFPEMQSNKAIYGTLSFGKLMLPKVYKNYDQINLNIMGEFLGQTLVHNGKSYVDVAPSLQLIIKSKMRLDFAYRKELLSSMKRTAPNGFMVRLEYNFFNVY